jgi:hypothetical protein
MDTRKESLLVRKQILRKVLGQKNVICFVDFVEAEGEVLLKSPTSSAWKA